MASQAIPARSELTQARLIELLIYDPATGKFRWRQYGRGRKPTLEAGCVRQDDGYERIQIDGAMYYSHRLAWLYMTGEWPDDEIDHEDGNRARNVWDNLRPATGLQQNQNRAARRDSKSGMIGASWDAKRGSWRASITVNGKGKFLGYFSEPMQASEAYAKAKAELHPFSPVVRSSEPVRTGRSMQGGS